MFEKIVLLEKSSLLESGINRNDDENLIGKASIEPVEDCTPKPLKSSEEAGIEGKQELVKDPNLASTFASLQAEISITSSPPPPGNSALFP